MFLKKRLLAEKGEDLGVKLDFQTLKTYSSIYLECV